MELNENAKIVAEKRYFREGESWGDLAIRVGSAIAANEENKNKWGEVFANEIANMNFIPGGRILRNAGGVKQSMLNCACLPISDSIEEIGETIKNALILWSYGAGIGIDFSPLRPRGMPLKSKGGESSGMISFLKAIDSVASTIETGGQRRSGCLAMCKVSHPEIFDFIKAKLVDKDLSYFNLSVAVTSSFLHAVENNSNWDLKFEGRTFKTIKARELWDLILDSMIKSGDPGLINYDNLVKNNSYYFQNISCVNLCQPKWATVLTKDGISTIEKINVGNYIWSKDGWARVTRKIDRGVDKVFKYKTNSSIFYGTKDHEIVSNGEKIEVDNADSIDSLTGPGYSNLKLDPQVVMDGIVLGDGSIHKASNNLVHLYIGENDYDYFNSEIKHLITKHRPGLKDTAYEIKTNITYKELPYTYLRKIPDRYKFGNKEIVAAFLRGLFTANGNVTVLAPKHTGRARIKLGASSKQVIEDTQLMLSSLGIRSYITTNKHPKPTTFRNGTYTSKVAYAVNITHDREKFFSTIGFIQKYKTNKLKDDLERKRSKFDNSSPKITFDIIENEYISEEPVYSITVDNKSHTYWSGGCDVSNCSELPLPAYGMCCLGSLVLPNFVPGTYTNWKALEETIRNAVRFLDNIIDINYYPIAETAKVSSAGRRIGLGVMGLHDYLLKKKIRYGSSESLDAIDKLFKFIRDTAYVASADLAEEKGAFPKYDRSQYHMASFVKRLPPKLRMYIKEKSIRNCSILSCPPTGTTSLVANVSSGIEPIFSLAYKRKDRVSERVYIHPLLKEILSEQKKIPDWLNDSFSLTPQDHFEVQCAIESKLDNSSSKTINCPRDTTADKLSKLLLEYIYDLVGITIYVDGSKGEQPLQQIPKKEIKKYIKQAETEKVEEEVQCKSGACDL